MAMMGVKRVFVDTNILIRATIMSAPLHKEAKQALDNLSSTDVELWISPQIIREYMVNTTREQSYSKPIPMPLVLEQIQRFRTSFKIAEETTAVLDEMLTLAASMPLRGKQIHDMNIVAAMIIYQIPQLLTHNIDDFKQFTDYIHVIPLLED